MHGTAASEQDTEGVCFLLDIMEIKKMKNKTEKNAKNEKKMKKAPEIIKLSWIDDKHVDYFSDEDFRKIYNFFVINTPCEDLSSRAITLQEYGWKTPWRKPFYLNKQLKTASSNYKLIYSASTYNAVADALEKSDLKSDFPEKANIERICIYDSKSNQFMSVFAHIRNAFAHGRFKVVPVNDLSDSVFIFEDIAKNNKISARMILRKSTLLKWISIISGGERKFEESNK